MKLFALVILPVGSNECILCIVKVTEYSLVKRKSCPENCRYHDAVVMRSYVGNSQRSDEWLFRILQCLADFVCENLSESLKVLAEAHTVFLDGLVAHLRNEFVEN